MCLPNEICAWARVPKCPQFLKVCMLHQGGKKFSSMCNLQNSWTTPIDQIKFKFTSSSMK